MGGRINEKYFKLSSRVFGGTLHRFLVYLLRFSGIFLILSALIPERLANVYFIGRFDPIQEQLIWQFPSILFGTLFIFMARLIRRRVKGAFIASLNNLCLDLDLCQSQWYFLGYVFPNCTLFGAYVDHQKEVVSSLLCL